MAFAARAQNALRPARTQRFAGGVLRHRVAAATEHLEAFSFTKAQSLIDIGANKGQINLGCRALRPYATIVAIKPMPDAVNRYGALFKDDNRVAISDGDGNGTQEIDVSVRRLESLIELANLPKPIPVKIDIQSAKLQALQGCGNLKATQFTYFELSSVELYEGQPLFDEVAAYKDTRGLTLRGVFNQVTTGSFGPTQADFLFERAQTGSK